MQCCASGHDVVDQRDMRWKPVSACGSGQHEGIAQVAMAFPRVQRRLRVSCSTPGEQIGAERQRESLRERSRELDRLVVAATAQARAVQRHRYQRIGPRRGCASFQHQLREQPSCGKVMVELEAGDPTVDRERVEERSHDMGEGRPHAPARIAAEIDRVRRPQRQSASRAGRADARQGGIAGGTQIPAAGAVLAAALAARSPGRPSPLRRHRRSPGPVVNRKLHREVDRVRHGFQTA